MPKEIRDHIKKVWYVCYGSNLSLERFNLYLAACTDKTKPEKEYQCEIPYKRFFYDKKTRLWPGSALAFIDKRKGSGTALGRAYLITEGQYDQIKYKEGANYTFPISLGKIEGIEAKTFTSDEDLKPDGSEPTGDYKRYIESGEKETKSLPYAEIKD